MRLSIKSERPVSVMFDDLDLIADVKPDYALGRRRGLTDEETEHRSTCAMPKQRVKISGELLLRLGLNWLNALSGSRTLLC